MKALHRLARLTRCDSADQRNADLPLHALLSWEFFVSHSLKQAAYDLAAWLANPSLLPTSKSSKINCAIGVISYPVYLMQYPMLKLQLMVLHHLRLDRALTPVEIVATLVASVVLTTFISPAVEQVREQNLAIQSAQVSARRQTRNSRYNSDSGFAVAGTNAPQSP